VTNELQQNRYDRLIRRVGAIIGTGSKVSEVLTELFPMIDVEGDRGELQLLSGVVLGMGSSSRLGAGGKRSRIQLFNPVGSGKIVTVTEVLINSATTQSISVGRTVIVESSGVGTQLTRDLRLPVSKRPVAQMFTGEETAIVDANINIRMLGSVMFTLASKNDVMILPPGTGINVGTSQVDTNLIVTFLWREREAETSELNF